MVPISRHHFIVTATQKLFMARTQDDELFIRKQLTLQNDMLPEGVEL